MLGTVLGLVKGGVEALGTFLRLRERSKNEQAGANEQRLKQIDEVKDAREKMDKIDGPTVDGAVDRLRKGGF